MRTTLRLYRRPLFAKCHILYWLISALDKCDGSFKHLFPYNHKVMKAKNCSSLSLKDSKKVIGQSGLSMVVRTCSQYWSRLWEDWAVYGQWPIHLDYERTFLHDIFSANTSTLTKKLSSSCLYITEMRIGYTAKNNMRTPITLAQIMRL